MKRLIPLLALLLIAASFGVHIVISAASVQYTNYIQTGAAVGNGAVVPFTVPITYNGSGTAEVSSLIPWYFANGTNFVISEDSVALSTNRIGDVLYWNATFNASPSLTFTVPAPSISLGAEQTGATYSRDITVSAQTLIDNASFSLTVPDGYMSFVLTESLNGTIDRTLTYGLTVVGTTAQFNTVYFTNSILQRNLTLTATAVPAPSGGGGGGGGGGGRITTNQGNLRITMPDQLIAMIGGREHAIATISNTGTAPVEVRITAEPATREFSISPASFTLQNNSERHIDLAYAPVGGAKPLNVTVRVAGGPSQHRSTIQLIPIPATYPITMTLQPSTTTVQVTGLVSSSGIVNGHISYFVRNEQGGVLPVADDSFQADQSYAFSQDVSLVGLPADTYEICVQIVDEYNFRSERCAPLRITVPVNAEFEEPAPTTPFQSLQQMKESGWVLPLAIVLLIVMAGVTFWFRRK